MKMLYRRQDEFIEYQLATDPVDAVLWSTHRLKKGEIFLKVKLDKKISADIRQEILDDILSREPNPSKKSAPTDNKIPKGRKSSKQQHAKARETKRKTG
jgi:hypothetical protein|tara:strand:+ start:1349 stop:1645 length:297 start_codon:yes stop_codon:yes gene_type:complete